MNRPPNQLWREGFPWKQREKRTLTSLKALAEGARPEKSQEDDERRATIIGGMNALNEKSVPGFKRVSADPTDKKTDKMLIARVRMVSPVPSQIKNLDSAAAFVRRKVSENGLESAAWAARALSLLRASEKKLKKTVTAGAAIAAGTKVGAAASNTIPVAGQIISAVLTAASAASTVALAQAKIQQKEVKDAIASYESLFTSSLSASGVAPEKAMQTLDQEKKEQFAALQQIDTEAQSAGTRNANLMKIGLWTAFAGTSLGIGYLLLRSREENR